MFKTNEEIKTKILKNKGFIFITLIVLSLLIPSVFASHVAGANNKKEAVKVVSEAPISSTADVVPTVTVIPSPTIFIPAPTLTPVPTLTPTLALTPTPTQTPTSTPTPTETLTPAPTVTPTMTPVPTPAGLKIQIGIDYAGQKSADSYSASADSGQTAWDAVTAAIGINNLQYTDYGGDMGIFITGFNGINAASNQYFEFRVNGVSSSVGVSSYKFSDGDKLDFVLMTF